MAKKPNDLDTNDARADDLNFVSHLSEREGIGDYFTDDAGDNMSRADQTNYVVEEANLDSDPPQATQFSDTSGQDQISDYVLDKSGAVESMSEHGIVDGYSDGTFSPDDAITREQFAKMANLEYDMSDPSHETTFTDADTISDWADSYTEKDEGAISGRAAEAVKLGKLLDASAKQGVATPGPDEGIAAPFIPGSAALSETKPDEEGLKPLDTEEA